MTAVDRKNEGFDRVFDLVGGHGRFQWRLLFVISLQLIILTWHHLGYTFLGNIPDHWCLVDELKGSNWTTEQIKSISIPRKSDNPNEFEQCNQYYLNFGSILQSYENFEEAYSSVDFKNATTKPCSKWEFDRSIFQSTVSTEFELVCGRRKYAATIQGSYMAGGLVGTIFFGSVSDRFLGRRKTVLIALTLVVLGGILASFAKSYWMFVLLRFVISIGVAGSMQNCFVLMMEHADKEYRAALGMLEQIPFAVGFMILPLYAYLIRNWSNLQLAFGVTSISLISYKWILPDSPRWLATHGKEEEALDCLLKIAKVNKLPDPSKEALLEIIRPCHEQHQIPGTPDGKSQESGDNQTSQKEEGLTRLQLFKHKFGLAVENFKNLMRTAEIRKRSLVFWMIFCTVSMVYYGLIFSANLTSDIFLYNFLSGLMEIPAYTLVVPLVTKYGRRPTTAANFFLTGFCMIGLCLTPGSFEILRIILAMSAKLFISSGFAIIYLLGAELYPTEMRTTGLAVGIFMGRMGAISAPYIADLLQVVSKDFPTVIFGISSLAAGFVSLGLPETGQLEMVDQIYEVERQVAEEKLKEKRNSTVDATYL